MFYTERINGFQIADPTYIGLPPKDTPPTFDVIKWFKTDPHEVCSVVRDKDGRWKTEKTIKSEFCYVVGVIEWDQHEEDFLFRSIGLRWLEEKPTEAVVNMILKFCAEKEKEMPGRYDER